MSPSFDKTLTRLIADIHESRDWQQRHWAVEGLCATDWPPALIPKVVEVLKLVLENDPASSIANALRNFAARHPAEAAALVPNIAAALPEADPGEKVTLAIALRTIGPPAACAADSLRELLAHETLVVRIHGASALARIRPNDSQACDLLLHCLSDKSVHVRWVSAYAVARSDIRVPKFVPVLKTLLTDGDVRVRVTAADALWHMTGDSADLVPLLVASLSEEHRALTTDFVYPSNSGDSHRVYALRTLAEMGAGARQAAAAILGQIEEAATDDRQSDAIANVGLTALGVLARLGPHEPEIIARLDEVRRRKGGFAERCPELTNRLIAAVETKSKKAGK